MSALGIFWSRRWTFWLISFRVTGGKKGILETFYGSEFGNLQLFLSLSINHPWSTKIKPTWQTTTNLIDTKRILSIGEFLHLKVDAGSLFSLTSLHKWCGSISCLKPLHVGVICRHSLISSLRFLWHAPLKNNNWRVALCCLPPTRFIISPFFCGCGVAA